MGGDIPGRFGEATEDESNVVRLFDPRSVPQGKSYFEVRSIRQIIVIASGIFLA